jgi:hypothetical protein
MKGASFILFFVLLQYTLTLTVLRVVTGNKNIFRQPITSLHVFWVLGLVLLSLPIYHYEEEFTAWSGAILCMTLFAFSVGAIVAEFMHRELRVPARSFVCPENIERLIFWILCLAICGVALRMINSYLTGGISMSDRLDVDNAQLIRELHMEGETSRIGPLYGPAAVTYALGAFGLVTYQILKGTRDVTGWRPSLLTRLACIAFVVLSLAYAILFSGGRMTMAFLGLLAFLGYASGRWATGQNVLRRKIGLGQVMLMAGSALVVLALLWVSSTTFLEKRTGESVPEAILFKTHRARFATEIQPLTSVSKTAGYAIFTLSYASTPVPTFVFYADLPDTRMPDLLWGQYSFPVVARYAMRMVGQYDPNDWSLAREAVFSPLAGINFGTNVWATMPRDLLIDFGFGGAILSMGLLGYLSQRLYIRERHNPTTASLALLGLVRLLLLFSGLTSLLYMPQYHWPLYFSIGYLFYSDRKAKQHLKKRQRIKTLAPLR